MPATRGVKRTASKSSAATSSTAPKNKKKRGAVLLDIPSAPKKRGRVFTCGQGDVGQLGLGEDVMETSKFKHVTALGDKIVDARGGMHTIALDSDGKVWTFGCNDEGALGRATSGERDEATPRRVTLPSRAVAIAAGDSHSAALLQGGDVYAWGAFRDSHGSMGLVMSGREGKASRTPLRLTLPEPAAAIASGGDHLVVLSTSGAVYTMGCGEQGQLGRLSQRSASRDARQGFSALLVPSKVTLKGGASKVWAGYHATFALNAANEKLFAWGLNNYGQLGISGEKRRSALFAPAECDLLPGGSWRTLAAGQHHTLALETRGRLLAVGRCEYGRLGLGDRVGDAETPEPVPKLENKKCVSIAAGTSNSFAVTDTGEAYAWGMGSEGQLGTGACSDANEPAHVHDSALRVSAGGQHTVLLVEDPSGEKEDSREPEQETEEQKVEEEAEDEEEVEKKPEKPKRQRKQEQEDEVTSTSSAQVAEDGEENKPQKVNGDEKKETPMEVDETDKAPEKEEEKRDTEMITETETLTEDNKETVTQPEPEPEAAPDTVTKVEKTETDSSQETDSETKSQDSQDDKIEKLNDVDMEKEVNGAPEVVEPKTVESITAANPLTTTA
ncbi:LOW QUALITY PROTEIN: regulator of chromosome condensation 1 [Aphomia sociella]